MRLCRLDLLRYGRFTGATVDFGAVTPGTPDLHVVYGANEAGKSTMLNAWMDLVFGIEPQTAYAFAHDYRDLLIGAVIETGGQSLQVSRIKGTKATLLGGDGQPLPEAVLRGPLGGLDRRSLGEMFSLDDETLEAGGKSILDSEGEVGQLLFASGAGLGGFAPALAELRRAPDPFFRPGAQKMRLADLKADLRAAEDEGARLDTDARGWKRLVQARDAAAAAWKAAEAARDAPAAALTRTRRHLAALPALRALDAAQARHDALPDLPAPPAGWGAELGELGRRAAAGGARAGALDDALADLRAERAALVPDPAALALRDRITALGSLRSAFDEGQKDLPARRAEALRLEAAVAAALSRLGRVGADPAEVIPGRAGITALRALIEAQSGVARGVANARAELARAEAELAVLDPADAAPGDAAPLALLVARLQEEAPGAALAAAQRALDEAEAALASRLASLRPWTGDLGRIALPAAATVAGWKARAAGIVQDRAIATEAVQRLDAALAAAIVPGAADDAATPDAVAMARAAREAAWAVHRAALDPATAEAFEAAMRRDDALTAGLAETMAGARRRAEALALRAAQGRERALAAERLDGIAATGAALSQEIAAALTEAGLPTMTPEALEGWLPLCRAAIEARTVVLAARAAVVRAEAAVAGAAGALQQALALAGVPSGATALPLLLAQARAVVEAAAAQAAQVQSQRRAEAQVRARRGALAVAEAAGAEWEMQWQAALAAAGLPAGHGLDAAREDIALLEALASDHRTLADLSARIAKMEANVAAYAGAVGALAQDLGLTPDAPDRQGEALADRLAAAQSTDDRARGLDARIEGAVGEVAAERLALSRIEARIAAMVAGFGAADAADLAARLSQAEERLRAAAEVARAGEALRETLGAATVEDARAVLAGLDGDALRAEEARLADEVTGRGAASQAAFAALSEAQRQLDAVGGDDAVLRLAERRETLLLEIAEGARAHLTRRLGLIALEHGLRRYRDRHRSAMIEAASAAFATLTRGAYAGLATQPEGAREVLVALVAGGGSRRAAELSKGTRFQLYLALRVAAHGERAALGPVPPFVADDIMETFDDDRAAEAFEVMAGMAARGQVIYLTHHRHLCEIARRVCPDVRLHRL